MASGIMYNVILCWLLFGCIFLRLQTAFLHKTEPHFLHLHSEMLQRPKIWRWHVYFTTKSSIWSLFPGLCWRCIFGLQEKEVTFFGRKLEIADQLLHALVQRLRGIRFGNYELMQKENKFSRPIVLGYPWHWHFLIVPLDYHRIHRLWSYSCRAKTTVFLSVLIKFKLFENPSYFIGVLPCPGHGIGTQGLSFEASLVAKWLHIWNAFVCNLKYKNVCILVSVGSILIF